MSLEVHQGMRKTKLNANRTGNRKPHAAGRRTRANQYEETPYLEEVKSEKPPYPDLDGIRPFLNERIAFHMPSDLKYLDGVLEYLNERMLRLGIVKPGDSEVLIALDEAIVNAIKHGNKCNPEKAVHIIAEMSMRGARFIIKDEGQGFSWNDVPDPTDPSRLLETSGRGLLLINHIMDEVCHNQCGNEIQMYKKSNSAPDGGKQQ
ncbi:MAG TPA: ATP-binding protein [Blastocatellia bacterium]|nr:ATP-binding protein [Blastocatellia bacterium]